MECFQGKSASLDFDALTAAFVLGLQLRAAAEADIVTNGAFGADTDWTKGTGWTISGGNASHAGGAGDLSQDGILTDAAVYRITFTISGRTAGTLTAKAGSGGAGTAKSTNATFTEYLTCTTSLDLLFTADAAFDGNVDDVVAYRVAVGTIVDIITIDSLTGTLKLNGLDTTVINDGLIEDTATGSATANGTLKNHAGNWERLLVAEALKFAVDGLKVNGVTVTGIDAPSFPANYEFLGDITEIQMASGSLIAYKK